MTDQDICTYYTNKVIHKWESIPNDHKEYLDKRFADSCSYKESVWRILYGIEQRPTCKICGNPVKFIGRKGNIFSKTCSNECNRKIHTIEKHYTTEELYYNSLSSKEKTKYTCLRKYGVEHVSMLHTNHFISDNPQKHTEIKDRTKQTRIKKYGQYMSPNNIESLNRKEVKDKRLRSFVISMRQKYGTENYRNREKYKETCLKRYGVDCWQKTSYFKDIMKDKNSSIQTKRHNTQKLNKTFNISKPENESYHLLKELWPDTIRQYRSEKYPFACDFYIPELDLYIECNYHWTHGGKLYEGTDEDITKVNKWKEKNTKFYNNAIETWTVRDVKKYQCALKHNINYSIFYNINELKLWAKSHEIKSQ